MIGYIIFEKISKNIIAIVHSKNAKDCYNSEIYDYTWWDTDDSGAFPPLESVFTETRTYDKIREAAYRLESDQLLPRVLGDEQDGNPDAWSVWVADRERIKTLVPKPC